MNMTGLIKVLPMLVMVAALAYAAYSIQPVVPIVTPAAGAAKPEKQAPVEGAGQAVTAAGSPDAPPAMRVAGRNPFQVVANPDPIADVKNSTPELEKTDSPLTTLNGLTLNATFLQGRTQMAIIDGRIYEPGQNLVGADNAPSALVLAQVLVNKVVFQAGGKSYFLAYPDQLASSNAGAGAVGARKGAGPPGKGSRASPKAKTAPRSSSKAVE